MTHELPYAEDVNYFNTGRSSPDEILKKAKNVIVGLGGTITSEAFGQQDGRAAYMLSFEITGDHFKIVWPVLNSHCGNDIAARRQAATFIYHDCKAKALNAAVLGHRRAFFDNLMLPDGRTAGDLALPELQDSIPKLLVYREQEQSDA